MNPTDQAVLDWIKSWGALVGIIFTAGMQYMAFKDSDKRQTECMKEVKDDVGKLKEREEGYRPYIDFANENRRRITDLEIQTEKLENDSRRFDIAQAKIETRLVEIDTKLFDLKQGQMEMMKAITNK